MYKYFIITLLLCVTSSVTTVSAANKTASIGINTNEAMDLGTSIPFVDLFKLSLPFEEARPWLTKGRITYDANGSRKTHTEYQPYEVTWCGDAVKDSGYEQCDPNDSSKL